MTSSSGCDSTPGDRATVLRAAESNIFGRRYTGCDVRPNKPVLDHRPVQVPGDHYAVTTQNDVDMYLERFHPA